MKNSVVSKFYTKENSKADQHQLNQSTAGAWDVVVLSFKLMFKRIQFWIRPNMLSVILSIPILTAPASKAALYRTVAAGLLDPGGSEVKVKQVMKEGFHQNLVKSLLLSIIKLLSLIIILASIFFWISRPQIALRFISTLSFYGMIIWWFASIYIYPIMVTNPSSDVISIIRKSLRLAFHKPFESLLFAIVGTLLLILGVILLGPIMLIVPAFRSILNIQGYWFLTGKEIPGFMSIDEYSKKKFGRETKGEQQ